ncbi:branched-chain amino acid ABC transporter permease [Desulfurella sp.]|uniref:branched-chain amino acid ABC transporter permease n=1 Tax=Desulfurella sp. TaxID=1962857 RepID=UPI003D0ED0E6
MQKGYTLFWLLPALIALVIYPIITDNVMLRETIFLILLSITLSVSLNIILGYTGYVSFGHIVYYGIGAYFAFYLMYAYKVNLIVSIVLGGLVSAAIAFVLGQAVLSLRGAIFAIATIGVNEAVKSLINNISFLGGAMGLYFDFSIYDNYGGALKAIWLSYYLMGILTILSVIAAYYIKKSKFGLGLFSIREDQDASSVLGIKTKFYKSLAYATSAFFPAIAGGVFAFKAGNIEPSGAFNLVKSIEMIVMVMLGGYGSVAGSALGALIYEKIKGMLLVMPYVKDLHLAVSGLILLIIVQFAPSGIVGFLTKYFKKLQKVLE